MNINHSLCSEAGKDLERLTRMNDCKLHKSGQLIEYNVKINLTNIIL